MWLHSSESPGFVAMVETIKAWLPTLTRGGRLAIHHVLTSADIGAAVYFIASKYSNFVRLELAGHRVAILMVDKAVVRDGNEMVEFNDGEVCNASIGEC